MVTLNTVTSIVTTVTRVTTAIIHLHQHQHQHHLLRQLLFRQQLIEVTTIVTTVILLIKHPFNHPTVNSMSAGMIQPVTIVLIVIIVTLTTVYETMTKVLETRITNLVVRYISITINCKGMHRTTILILRIITNALHGESNSEFCNVSLFQCPVKRLNCRLTRKKLHSSPDSGPST